MIPRLLVLFLIVCLTSLYAMANGFFQQSLFSETKDFSNFWLEKHLPRKGGTNDPRKVDIYQTNNTLAKVKIRKLHAALNLRH